MRHNVVEQCLRNLTNANVTQTQIAKALGVKVQTINKRAGRNSVYSDDEIALLEKAFNVNLSSNSTTNDYIEIPVRGEVTASLGTGVEVYNEDKTSTYQLGAKLLRDIGASRQFSEIIFARGDSMEPTIEGGDSLLVDRSKTEIYDGKIYCVRINNKLYAKRLQLIPPYKIKVISDNREKYDPFYIDLSKDVNFDFAVIGEVKWWGRVAK